MFGRKTQTTGASDLRRLLILACMSLAACGPYPDDVSGTLDRVERSGRIRIGLAELREPDSPVAGGFIARLEQATGAQAEVERGSLEHQLVRLEDGELDLVIAELDRETPWAQSVSVIEPLSTRRVGRRTLELAPVTQPGENRWIALIEREVRNGARQTG